MNLTRPVPSTDVEPAGSEPLTPIPWPRHVLVLRFTLVNLVALGGVGAIYLSGWLDGALVGYTGWLCLAIVAVFLYGLALCTVRVWRVNRELDHVCAALPPSASLSGHYLAEVAARSDERRMLHANLLRLRLTHSIAVVRQVAGSLVFLGLIGTVIGFIVALSGVDPGMSTTAGDVAALVSTLISGMSIALYTTLIGAVLHVWLMIDHRLLASAVVRLFDAIVARGERGVGV